MILYKFNDRVVEVSDLTSANREHIKEIHEKSKARKDAEDFSLIFEKACKEVANDQDAN